MAIGFWVMATPPTCEIRPRLGEPGVRVRCLPCGALPHGIAKLFRLDAASGFPDLPIEAQISSATPRRGHWYAF